MDYPCNCPTMKMIIETNTGSFEFNNKKYKLLTREDNFWVLSWIQLDKVNKGINIEEFGIKLEYCPFCGKKIKG